MHVRAGTAYSTSEPSKSDPEIVEKIGTMQGGRPIFELTQN